MTSITDQERQIKETIRKAKQDPDKAGVLRRNTLQRLIDLIHSPHPPLKIIAAANIRYFFNDFPELEELAINAVYDLCEDQSSNVRMEGYNAITHVSRSENKWIKRNADVLLQLLQSDEPEEVEVVKNALTEHLDMDPKVTLGVLCDQIVPIDEPMDVEEQNIRDRLRFLVLSFLQGEAQGTLVTRHALPGSDGEETLTNGLMAAIPKLNFSDVNTIVRRILLPLPTYQAHSKRGSLLISTLLRNTTDSLRDDLQSGRPDNPASLTVTQPYLDLAISLVNNQTVPAIDLLQFYCTHFIGKITLQRLKSDDQTLLICQLTEVLTICDQNVRTQDEPQLQALRRQIVDACPFLLQCLCKSRLSNPRTTKACSRLLRVCVARKNKSAWTLPPNLLTALETIKTSLGSEQPQDVQNLIRSLAPPSSPRRTVAVEVPHMAGLSIKGSSNLPMKPNTNGINASRPTPGRQTSHGQAMLPPFASGSIGQDGSLGNSRKRKGSAGSGVTPTLLSRLGSPSSTGFQWNNRGQDLSDNPFVHDSPPSRSEFSIKGAADRSSESTDSHGPRSSSLLDRLEGGPALTENDIEANDRKKRRRGNP